MPPSDAHWSDPNALVLRLRGYMGALPEPTKGLFPLEKPLVSKTGYFTLVWYSGAHYAM